MSTVAGNHGNELGSSPAELLGSPALDGALQKITARGKPMQPATKFEDYLERGTQVMSAVTAGVRLAESVAPYLRPLVIAAL